MLSGRVSLRGISAVVLAITAMIVLGPGARGEAASDGREAHTPRHFSGPERPFATDPHEATLGGHDIEEGEVIDYASRHGVTHPVARRAIALQARASALRTRASRQFPDSFAGLWMAPDHHERIIIAFTDQAEDSVAVLRRDFFRPETLISRSATHSAMELRDLTRALQAHVGVLSDAGVTGWGSLERTNGLRVHVREHTPEVEAIIRRYTGPAIPLEIVVTGEPTRRSIPPSNLACAIVYHSCIPFAAVRRCTSKAFRRASLIARSASMPAAT